MRHKVLAEVPQALRNLLLLLLLLLPGTLMRSVQPCQV
jgi:hypothetical protein